VPTMKTTQGRWMCFGFATLAISGYMLRQSISDLIPY
jgi:hypothetical protein